MKKIKLLLLFIALSFCSKPVLASSNDTLIVTPNPFDSIAVIHFEIANNDTIWLNVLNATGNIIKTYFNGTVLSSGTYSLNFNGDTLPNGIYFVSLKINSTKTLTVKLIKGANTVGLNENNLFKNIEVYPNPNTGKAIINLKDVSITNIALKVYDVNGRVVFEDKITDISDKNYELTINVKSGIYFVEVIDTNTETYYKQKLVIQK